ncbi:FAD-binding protein [Arthrobacter sp. PAMC25564]|uniref:FAD-binding protein n=1 Tax=Arthrobacter sp. PAMC25564 TaxID=2565366 RepID=UPI00197BF0D6|nr:FAD-binding protein [Arthrobacter sp. PAMC25564]
MLPVRLLYNHFRGDMEHKPNPNLAPVGKGPYYAAKIQMGDLGTFAGIGVNERCEVTTEEGTAIPGPALVFGYRPEGTSPSSQPAAAYREWPASETPTGPDRTPSRRFEGVRKQDAQW